MSRENIRITGMWWCDRSREIRSAVSPHLFSSKPERRGRGSQCLEMPFSNKLDLQSKADHHLFYITKLVAKEKKKKIQTHTQRDIQYTYRYTNTKIRILRWSQLGCMTWQIYYSISLTRQIQSKLNFKLLHAFGPQNTGQVETKELLAVFNRINVASLEKFHKESINDKVQGL